MKHIKGEFKVNDISVDQLGDIRARIRILESDLEEKIKEIASDALYAIFMQDKMNIYFPQIYKSDKELENPLSAFIKVYYSDDDIDPVVFEFNLKDLLMEGCKEKEFAYGSSVVSKALRKLADEIDQAISNVK